MSIAASIEADFRRTVGDQVTIEPEGIDRYRVRTPFRLDDGDHIVVVLHKDSPDHWRLTDEGNTFMKLTYELDEQDFRQGTRADLIDTALASYHIEDREGELVVPIPGKQFGDALYSMVQAILRISDVEYLTRERAKTTFFEDVRQLVRKTIPAERIEEKWHHPTKDPNEHYPVDYYVNGAVTPPLLIFALQTDEQVRDATIIIRQFESWIDRFHSLGIFEEQEKIARKVLARFSDVCEKQFSNVPTADERMERFLRDTTIALH